MPATETLAGGAGPAVIPLAGGVPAISFTFSKQQRLLTPRAFKAVFDQAIFKISHRSLLLLAIPNGNDTARLGLVVAKKNAKLAVQRNRLKRLLRENFRLHQHQLAGLDIVALVKPGLWQQENAAISALIEEQWQRLLKQQMKSRQAPPPAAGSPP